MRRGRWETPTRTITGTINPSIRINLPGLRGFSDIINLRVQAGGDGVLPWARAACPRCWSARSWRRSLPSPSCEPALSDCSRRQGEEPGIRRL